MGTMKNIDSEHLSKDYRLVEQAIYFLEAHAHHQPELNEIAEHCGLSEYHFQRVFARWAGISPKRFLQFLTRENAKHLLNTSGSLLEAAYSSGLSGPGRLHDLFVNTEAVTPGEYKQRGAGLKIAYGFHATPFGECLVGLTERGICSLSFHSVEQLNVGLDELHSHFPAAHLYEDIQSTAWVARAVFNLYQGRTPGALHLHLQGTNF